MKKSYIILTLFLALSASSPYAAEADLNSCITRVESLYSDIAKELITVDARYEAKISALNLDQRYIKEGSKLFGESIPSYFDETIRKDSSMIQYAYKNMPEFIDNEIKKYNIDASNCLAYIKMLETRSKDLVDVRNREWERAISKAKANLDIFEKNNQFVEEHFKKQSDSIKPNGVGPD